MDSARGSPRDVQIQGAGGLRCQVSEGVSRMSRARWRSEQRQKAGQPGTDRQLCFSSLKTYCSSKNDFLLMGKKPQMWKMWTLVKLLCHLFGSPVFSLFPKEVSASHSSCLHPFPPSPPPSSPSSPYSSSPFPPPISTLPPTFSLPPFFLFPSSFSAKSYFWTWSKFKRFKKKYDTTYFLKLLKYLPKSIKKSTEILFF